MSSSAESGVGQALQDGLQRENADLQKLQAQKQQGQGLLNRLGELEAQLQAQFREVSLMH